MRVPQKHIYLTVDLVLNIVQNWFEDMQNPEFRGENFTWDYFPEMMKNYVSSSLWMSYPHNIWDKYGEELIKIGIKVSNRLSKNLITNVK